MIRLRDHSTPEQHGWYLYDFAQSAFSTTVATLFLGPYLTVSAKAAADAHGVVHPLGVPVDARSYWSYMISLSVILQVVLLPIVGAVVDYGRRKKETLGAMAYLGAAATMAMFFLEGEHYLFGGVLFLIADVSFGAGLVIYDSFLPEIAPPEDRDAVSSRGWGIGYLGGGLLLALNLVLYLNAARMGMSEAMAVRISLSSAGVWPERDRIDAAATGAHSARGAPLPADNDIHGGLSAIQRRHSDGDYISIPVRSR